jgi:hypothetical protein
MMLVAFSGGLFMGLALGSCWAGLIGWPEWQPTIITNDKGDVMDIDKYARFTWRPGVVTGGVYWLVRRARERTHKRGVDDGE